MVASMERVVDPKSGSGALAALQGILSPGGTKAIDTSTVEFKLDKPFADFPYLVCQSSYNTVILPRNYSGNFVKKPGRHRPLHAAVVQRQAAGRHGQEPHLLGQGRRRQPAAVPRPGHLGHGAGRVGRQPAAAVRRRRLPAADGVPGLAGAVRRSRTCASTSTPAPASARSPSTSRRTRGRALPRSSARPWPTASTARPSTRPCTTAAATSATTPSGSRRCSPAARRRPSARRTTTRPSSCSPTAGFPNGHHASS